MIQAAKVQAAQMINKCFGGGVTSEAKDGVAPELNPGWVHRRINTYPEARHAQLFQLFCADIEQIMRLTYLAATAIPSTGHPDPIRALRHPWLR